MNTTLNPATRNNKENSYSFVNQTEQQTRQSQDRVPQPSNVQGTIDTYNRLMQAMNSKQTSYSQVAGQGVTRMKSMDKTT